MAERYNLRVPDAFHSGQRLIFAPQHDSLFFAAIPASPAVFLLRPAETSGSNAEPYVSKTANLRRRLQRLLGKPENGSRKLSLREMAGAVEFWLTGSEFETSLRLYQLLRQEFPQSYQQRLRLRPAPLIQLHLGNPYPRASVTTRLGRLGGASRYYGPFYSRGEAESYLNDSLDFFLLRRCVDDLHPDPAFPGCIYSEMKMCLAPCYKGCSDEAYAAETARVQGYLETGGRSLMREWEVAREAASAELDFEQAAAIHVRLEKLKPVAGRPAEIVQRIDQLHGLMVQRSAREGCVALFAIEAARVRGPIHFSIQPELEAAVLTGEAPHARQAQPRSLEARVEAALAAAPPLGPATATETMEHLAMLRRWFYRGSRVGEVFFANEQGELPMRRIVRGIGRVFRGDAREVPQAGEHMAVPLPDPGETP